MYRFEFDNNIDDFNFVSCSLSFIKANVDKVKFALNELKMWSNLELLSTNEEEFFAIRCKFIVYL